MSFVPCPDSTLLVKEAQDGFAKLWHYRSHPKAKPTAKYNIEPRGRSDALPLLVQRIPINSFQGYCLSSIHVEKRGPITHSASLKPNRASHRCRLKTLLQWYQSRAWRSLQAVKAVVYVGKMSSIVLAWAGKTYLARSRKVTNSRTRAWWSSQHRIHCFRISWSCCSSAWYVAAPSSP